jgi:hypothetical protein
MFYFFIILAGKSRSGVPAEVFGERAFRSPVNPAERGSREALWGRRINDLAHGDLAGPLRRCQDYFLAKKEKIIKPLIAQISRAEQDRRFEFAMFAPNRFRRTPRISDPGNTRSAADYRLFAVSCARYGRDASVGRGRGDGVARPQASPLASRSL